MSAASKLRPLLPEIRAELAGLGRPWVPDLLEHLRVSLEAAEGRGASAPQRSAERSAEIRAGILRAAGALTTVRRGAAAALQLRITRKGPKTYGLKRVPDLRTIRAALRTKNSIPVPACTHEAAVVDYGATVAPTT